MPDINFEEVVQSMKTKLDETSGAKISDELVTILGMYKGQEEELSKRQETINSLQQDKDELLKVNGRLFQKIGFEKEPEKSPVIPGTKEEPRLKLEDLIDSKGNIK